MKAYSVWRGWKRTSLRLRYRIHDGRVVKSERLCAWQYSTPQLGPAIFSDRERNHQSALSTARVRDRHRKAETHSVSVSPAGRRIEPGRRSRHAQRRRRTTTATTATTTPKTMATVRQDLQRQRQRHQHDHHDDDQNHNYQHDHHHYHTMAMTDGINGK